MIALDLTRAYRRARLPVILAALAIALALGGNWFLTEQAAKAKRAAQGAANSLNRLERQIRQLERGSERFSQTYPIYRRLVDNGLIGRPDLGAAENLLRGTARAVGVNQAAYEVRPSESYRLAELSDQALYLTVVPVRLRLEALLDSDISAYTRTVMNGLPGLTAIRSFAIERVNRSTAPVVNELLGAGQAGRPAMFRAEVTLDWMRMQTGAENADP